MKSCLFLEAWVLAFLLCRIIRIYSQHVGLLPHFESIRNLEIQNWDYHLNSMCQKLKSVAPIRLFFPSRNSATFGLVKNCLSIVTLLLGNREHETIWRARFVGYIMRKFSNLLLLGKRVSLTLRKPSLSRQN